VLAGSETRLGKAVMKMLARIAVCMCGSVARIAEALVAAGVRRGWIAAVGI